MAALPVPMEAAIMGAVDPKTGHLVVIDVRAQPVVAMGNDAWTLLRSFAASSD